MRRQSQWDILSDRLKNTCSYILSVICNAGHFPEPTHVCRFHPPAVVGVMGSAAACANLMALDADACVGALGVAASMAGAPMANAGTKAKPLHTGRNPRLTPARAHTTMQPTARYTGAQQRVHKYTTHPRAGSLHTSMGVGSTLHCGTNHEIPLCR